MCIGLVHSLQGTIGSGHLPPRIFGMGEAGRIVHVAEIINVKEACTGPVHVGVSGEESNVLGVRGTLPKTLHDRSNHPGGMDDHGCGGR